MLKNFSLITLAVMVIAGSAFAGAQWSGQRVVSQVFVSDGCGTNASSSYVVVTLNGYTYYGTSQFAFDISRPSGEAMYRTLVDALRTGHTVQILHSETANFTFSTNRSWGCATSDTYCQIYGVAIDW